MAQGQPSGEQAPAREQANERTSWRPRRTAIQWAVAGALVFVLILAGYWVPWTGFDARPISPQYQSEKTLWDWLGLLIVPAVIAAVGLWYNHTQKQTELKTAREHREQDKELARQEREQDRKLAEERWQRDQQLADQRRELDQKMADERREQDQKIADERRQQEQELADRRRRQEQELADAALRESALQAYLDRMSELLLDKGLAKSEEADPVRDVARARTLTVLRRLRGDGDRKAAVLQFLHEADLIDRGNSIVTLNEADLSAANLLRANLSGANLSGTDLSEASLFLANLSGANLSEANLTEANLSRADLSGAYLSGANLNGADLSWAHLIGANLFGADLWQARLLGALFVEPRLIKAARNWQHAIYDANTGSQLGLPLSYVWRSVNVPPDAERATPDRSQVAAEAQAPTADQPEPTTVEPQAPASQPEQQEPGATLPEGTKHD